jgi:rRNA maturation endonuclease Nob1
MRTLGQIKRETKKQMAFSVKCAACKKENPPKIDDENKIACGACGNELTDLPKPFQQVIRNFFRAQRKDL